MSARLRRSFLCLLLLAVSTPAFVEPRQGPAQPVSAAHGMVVSAEAQATEVGVEVLKQGGNAFDAAAAVGFALAVTYPTAGNIGGGGFCVGLRADGSTFALDFREKAPAAAAKDMFLDAKGDFLPEASRSGHRAVGVPGSTDGLLLLAEKYGTRPRKEILAPAIRLAHDGYLLPRPPSERLKENPAAAAIYFPPGKTFAAGDRLIQKDLAAVLTDISDRGRDGFYSGRVADLIVAEMKRGGGLISHEDLRGYQTRERKPFIFRHGEYELITMPLPSSGGVTLAQILGMLDFDELKKAGHQSARYIHLLTEAERLAYADRNYYLGDPDFVTVPVEKLTSPAYLKQRRALMPDGKAGRSEGVTRGSVESEETTHYCVVDQWGNVAAITYTLNSGFGAGLVVEGAGFLLNNNMDNFSAKPGTPNQYGMIGAEANSIAPHKRMLSSMTPTIVRRAGRFHSTIGSPGGPTIITTVLQLFLNLTVFDMNIRQAIDAGRVHHQWFPDTIQPEEGAVIPEVKAELERMGYQIQSRRSIGMAAGIVRTKDGGLAGHADRRGLGTAAGH